MNVNEPTTPELVTERVFQSLIPAVQSSPSTVIVELPDIVSVPSTAMLPVAGTGKSAIVTTVPDTAVRSWDAENVRSQLVGLTSPSHPVVTVQSPSRRQSVIRNAPDQFPA